MGHHSTLIGGGKGEGSLFCSDAHNIIASVVNVLTRIVGVSSTGSLAMELIYSYWSSPSRILNSPLEILSKSSDSSAEFTRCPHVV